VTGEPTASFDGAILSLILSVVPEPRMVMAETMRLLRPGGRAVIFDKFAPGTTPPSRPRRALNRVTTLFGTEIDRRLGDLMLGQPCRIIADEPSILGGQYRVILLVRDSEPAR
jgi:ubiquinone/menaquinone biosynthesis C-methylase UbiE